MSVPIDFVEPFTYTRQKKKGGGGIRLLYASVGAGEIAGISAEDGPPMERYIDGLLRCPLIYMGKLEPHIPNNVYRKDTHDPQEFGRSTIILGAKTISEANLVRRDIDHSVGRGGEN